MPDDHCAASTHAQADAAIEQAVAVLMNRIETLMARWRTVPSSYVRERTMATLCDALSELRDYAGPVEQDGSDQIMRSIRRTRGQAVRIAEACGINKTAVYQWKRVPPERVPTVSTIIGLPPEQIRPDVFR
jgi:hypothetical protein